MLNVKIMRGVPGSGKSTWCRTNLVAPIVFSADDHFTSEDGVYRFDPAKLSEAHGNCLLSFVSWLEHKAKYNHVNGLCVIDNTNIRAVEIAPYYQLALAYGCDVEIVQINVDPQAIERIVSRNLHGVPAASVARMAESMRNEILNFQPWWKVTHHDAILEAR